jgi:hypothetical protein
VRKAVEKAKEGDSIALRLCLERIVPPRRDRPISFALPTITTDAMKATGALIAAVVSGAVTPSEAAELSKLIEGYLKSLESTDFADRILNLRAWSLMNRRPNNLIGRVIKLERLRRPKGGRFFMIWGRDDINLARPHPKVRPTRRIDGAMQFVTRRATGDVDLYQGSR